MVQENMDRIIYQLTSEDVNHVAMDTLGRPLTNEEFELIVEKLSDNINWYDAVYYAIIQNIK